MRIESLRIDTATSEKNRTNNVVESHHSDLKNCDLQQFDGFKKFLSTFHVFGKVFL